jgi:hypothetical protein
MKKPASVHIDIAEFSMTVMELSVEERSDWLLSLVKCLSYADPTLNEYGAKLLNEVETYREAERKRKEKYSDKGETRKDTERHGKTEIPKRDTTEQTDRTEQTVLKEKDTIVSKKKAYSESFETFWKAYCRPKDKGSKPDSFKEWQKLTESEQQKAIDSIIPYKNSQSSPEYMKHAERYLKSKAWEGINYNKEESQEELEFVEAQ